MKASLQSLIERNQEVNFANFERIQQLIDEQESTLVEKQNSMQQFANCLEQILMTLKESDLVEIAPYSALVVITPFDDALFKCTPDRDDYSKSEYQVIARNKRNDDRLISSKGQLRGAPAEVSEQHQLRGIKPKQRLVAKISSFKGPRQLSSEQEADLKKLVDFIGLVRSNDEATLHQGSDVDSRWKERSAQQLPAQRHVQEKMQSQRGSARPSQIGREPLIGLRPPVHRQFASENAVRQPEPDQQPRGRVAA